MTDQQPHAHSKKAAMNKQDVERLAKQACAEADALVQSGAIRYDAWMLTRESIFAALVLEEAAKVCDQRFEDRSAWGFAREAASARWLANTLRTIAEGLKP